MKKILIFLFALVLLAPLASAQTLTFKDGDALKVYNGVAGDTLNGSRILAKTIFVNKDYLYHVNAQIEADSAGTGADITVNLQGSWDNANWVNIGSSVTWEVTAADTVFSINSLTVQDTYAGFTVTTDTAGLMYYPAKSQVFPAQTVTRAINGIMYPYLRVYFLGASGADMKLQRLIVKIIQANK